MKKTVTTITFLALTVAIPGLPALARQDQHGAHHQDQVGQALTAGKKGEVHFTTAVKAGDALLKPGMYQVQHVVEGDDHVIVFKEMEMPAAYRMSNTPVGKEVARIKCKVEPVDKKAGNTKITLQANDKGEKEITEVQVAGEAFKHLL